MAETPTAPLLPDQPNPDQIVDLNIERELQDSYLTYAMSTIMDRALPDARDGLKPSQRRILVAMNDLNLGARAKHRKCAKICGDVSGNYHPHGEAVIYPTLVRFAQDWVMRYLLVDKQGNFGSIDGDPPAAMRYTEARMTEASGDMLEDLKLDTVAFKANYDDTRQEPVVLPSKFPNLLVNGSTGIAVGMSCSIPPHNLGEICRAIEAVINNPEISLNELMEIVPGPDFPTGGLICGRSGIRAAYATGRGRAVVRGVVHVEDRPGGRQQLVIDEIPYHLVQNSLIEKITDAVKNDRIKDISSIRNESGRKSRTRVVLELKKGADPAIVENQLYQFTPLQSTFSIINIALVNHQPRTLTLRQMIDCYVDHRVEVIRRRTSHLLKEARKKAHILEGLIYAVCDIDEVIRLIRSSATRDEAIEGLMDRSFRIAPDHKYAPRIPQRLLARAADGVALTRVQAEAIGRLQLIQLVGLEIEKLTGDYTAIVSEIEGYEAILADHRLVLDIIREDVIEMREKYGDARRSKIVESAEDINDADLIAVEDVVLTISHEGYIKRLPADTYREQGRGGRGIKGSEKKDSDFIEHLFVASTHDDLLCLTDTGRMFKIKVYEAPEMGRTSKGRPIVNYIDLREGERVRAFIPVKDFEQREDYLVFATANGTVKRTALKDYRNVNRSGIIAIGLREGDELMSMVLTSGENDLLLATANGMAIRFSEQDVRVMGRTAAGVRGINLEEGDHVIGLIIADDSCDLLTVTEFGYGKRTAMAEYLVQSDDGTTRVQSRGGKGRRDIRVSQRNGRSVAILAVREEDSVLLVTEWAMVVRIAARSISRIGRNTQGVRVTNLKEGDRLIAVAKVVESDSEDDEG
ncbi:MAG: DNA gyrase subunit A [Phycisphaerales bacterium]|nr:DNA gyrase subunit A [Phycisphaerales bacterium]